MPLIINECLFVRWIAKIIVAAQRDSSIFRLTQQILPLDKSLMVNLVNKKYIKSSFSCLLFFSPLVFLSSCFPGCYFPLPLISWLLFSSPLVGEDKGEGDLSLFLPSEMLTYVKESPQTNKGFG